MLLARPAAAARGGGRRRRHRLGDLPSLGPLRPARSRSWAWRGSAPWASARTSGRSGCWARSQTGTRGRCCRRDAARAGLLALAGPGRARGTLGHAARERRAGPVSRVLRAVAPDPRLVRPAPGRHADARRAPRRLGGGRDVGAGRPPGDRRHRRLRRGQRRHPGRVASHRRPGPRARRGLLRHAGPHHLRAEHRVRRRARACWRSASPPWSSGTPRSTTAPSIGALGQALADAEVPARRDRQRRWGGAGRSAPPGARDRAGRRHGAHGRARDRCPAGRCRAACSRTIRRRPSASASIPMP